MLFMDMANSLKVGAVNGCPKEFSANTWEAFDVNPKVSSTAEKTGMQLWDHLLGGGVGGFGGMAGGFAVVVGEEALWE